MSIHRSVLLNEAILGLNLKSHNSIDKPAVLVDGTFGGGGHAKEACRMHPGIRIVAIDRDGDTWQREKKEFKKLDCKISFRKANFRNLDEVLRKEGLPAQAGVREVDGVLLDLGLSSDQLQNSGRGFSFMKDEPLLMTMKENPLPEDLSAEDVLNDWSEENLADIIYGYGEERYARKIARGIVEARKKKRITSTFELAKIIYDSVPGSYKHLRIHPATKTFQAIRIAVNDELGALSEGLKKGWRVLRTGGRIAVITFHSLEDRIVKRWSKSLAESGEAKLINKKPIEPTEEEIAENPRARSAKLRIIEKITA